MVAEDRRLQPKVSVVIPVYNNSATLVETIESVLAQTFADYEVILVDDGSSDNSGDLISTYANAHPGTIHHIRQNNAGAAGARNTGMRQARGEYIAFLDADDRWTPEKLAIQTDYMDRHPALGFSCTETFVIDAAGNRTGHWKMGHRVETFESLYDENFVYCLTTMVRRTSLDVVGEMDTSLRVSQDYDLWLRLARHFPFGNIPKPLAEYRLHGGNLSADTRVRLKDNLRVLTKPEISGGVPPGIRRIRIATTYLRFADEFARKGEWLAAGRGYARACLTVPHIGSYHWPRDASGKRLEWPWPFRVARIYGLAISCFLKAPFARKRVPNL